MQSKEDQDEGNRGKTQAGSSHFPVEPHEDAQSRSKGNCAAGSGATAVDAELARKRAAKASIQGARVSSTDSNSHNSVDDLLRRIARQATDRRQQTDRDVSDSSRHHRRQSSSSHEERPQRSPSRRRHNSRSSRSSRWGTSSSSGAGARSPQEPTSRSRFSGTDEGGQRTWDHRGKGVEP
ncbi:unnamed protein product, partial [Laminaria digitata]